MKNIDAPTLTHVWQELETRIDACRITRGAHTERLQLSKEKNFFSFAVAVKNSIKVGPYETPCMLLQRTRNTSIDTVKLR
jgi:hypothetical protein